MGEGKAAEMAEETGTTGTTEGGQAAGTETGQQQTTGEEGRGGKDAILADLAKERRARQALQDKLDKLENAGKTEQQRIADALSAATKERDAAQTELLQYRVAAKKKLPAELAGRLRGSNEEELLADADVLLAQLKPTAPPSFDGGARGGSAAAGPKDMNALIRKIAGVSD